MSYLSQWLFTIVLVACICAGKEIDHRGNDVARPNLSKAKRNAGVGIDFYKLLALIMCLFFEIEGSLFISPK